MRAPSTLTRADASNARRSADGEADLGHVAGRVDHAAQRCPVVWDVLDQPTHRVSVGTSHGTVSSAMARLAELRIQLRTAEPDRLASTTRAGSGGQPASHPDPQAAGTPGHQHGAPDRSGRSPMLPVWARTTRRANRRLWRTASSVSSPVSPASTSATPTGTHPRRRAGRSTTRPRHRGLERDHPRQPHRAVALDERASSPRPRQPPGLGRTTVGPHHVGQTLHQQHGPPTGSPTSDRPRAGTVPNRPGSPTPASGAVRPVRAGPCRSAPRRGRPHPSSTTTLSASTRTVVRRRRAHRRPPR